MDEETQPEDFNSTQHGRTFIIRDLVVRVQRMYVCIWVRENFCTTWSFLYSGHPPASSADR